LSVICSYYLSTGAFKSWGDKSRGLIFHILIGCYPKSYCKVIYSDKRASSSSKKLQYFKQACSQCAIKWLTEPVYLDLHLYDTILHGVWMFISIRNRTTVLHIIYCKCLPVYGMGPLFSYCVSVHLCTTILHGVWVFTSVWNGTTILQVVWVCDRLPKTGDYHCTELHYYLSLWFFIKNAQCVTYA